MLASNGCHDTALMVFLMFTTYARPGEIRGLTARQVLRPTRRSGPLSHWAISIAPQEDDASLRQALSKMGTMDDTILLDAPRFLGPLLGQRLVGRRPRDCIFPLAADTTVAQFRQASDALGLPELSLYQLRHGGASEDALSRARPLAEIRARGRWRSDSSLRRYAKPAMLQKLLQLKKVAPRRAPSHNALTCQVDGTA